MAFYTNVTRYGNKILHRYIDDSGDRINAREDFEPTIYLTSNEETGWKTLKGVNVLPKRFEKMGDARDFIKQFKDIRPDVVHGNTDFDLAFIHEYYPNEIGYQFDRIKTFFCDIEVDVPTGKGFPDPKKAEYPINAITVYDTVKQKYYVFSTVVEHYKPKVKNALYLYTSTERELITAFMNFWERDHPDILTGWNIEGFDVPYLINRISKTFGEDFCRRLSPWNKIDARESTNSFGQPVVIYDIKGVEVIDYLDLYKKFTLGNKESYKLGFIAQEEIGETKVEYDGDLYQFARQDPERFLDYNLIDVQLLVKMEAKLNLLLLCVTVAYMMKVNYGDALGTVRPWTSKVVFELLKENKVVDAYHRTEATEYGGGYVKSPLVGKYGWVVSYDFTSLYPHIMMGWNISPETKLQYKEVPQELLCYYGRDIVEILKTGSMPEEHVICLIENDICISGNGMFYHRSYEGIVPRLVGEVFRARKAKKKEMLAYKSEKQTCKDPARLKELELLIRTADVMQNALKVAANSFYGAIANIHFPLYDVDNAAAITLTGQAGIQYMANGMSDFVNKLSGVKRDCVITIDTDSAYLDISDLTKKVGVPNDPTAKNVDIVTKFADSKMKDASVALANEFHQFCNVRWNSLDFKREKVIFGGVWVAKKRYFCKVYDSEGVRYAEPDFAITGLETNRSSTPKFIRNKLTEALEAVVDFDEAAVQKFVEDFYMEFMKTDFADIAFPRGVNNLETYSDKVTIYKKGCPMHVRASLLYNNMLRKHGLENKYQNIHSGDKIKYVFLKTPNPVRENVIAYVDKFPAEFGLMPFIDYELMFDKTFKEPLQNVLTALSWNAVKINSLEDFFG